jgi:argininosuccinate lyase
VPLPLDRALTARLLGLDGVDANTLHVQNTRGRLEGLALFGLHQLSLTLGRLAADLVTFSSEAHGFFRLPVELTTGSSIMPQKRNPDVFELIRTVPAALLARYVEVSGVLHGLPAGYHRDLQRTKGPLLTGLAHVRTALRVMAVAAERLEIDEAACRAACTPEILATDAALAQVAEGVPFRDAYRVAKARPEPDRGPAAIDLDAALAVRSHEGAPGTDPLPGLAALAAGCRERLQRYAVGARTARSLLFL